MKTFRNFFFITIIFSGAIASSEWSAVLNRGGFQGTYALGAGYEWPESSWGAELTLGVTDVYGDAVYQLNMKSLYDSLEPVTVYEKHVWRPLIFGVGLMYGLGEKYFVLSPDHYPTQDYYPTNALRGLIQVGSRWDYQLENPTFKKVSFHLDLVTTDSHLVLFFNNHEAVGFSELVSLSLAGRVYF